MLKTALIVALLGCLFYFIADKAMFLGFHLHFYKHQPGKCQVISNAGLGSEDIHITSTGLAFISSGCAYATSEKGYLEFMEKNGIKGRVLLYDFNNPKQGAVELKIRPNKHFQPSTFRPHGISVLDDVVGGEHLIYVISHPFPEPDVVEKFKFVHESKELIHLKSFSGEVLRVTNDLVLLDEDEFFIDNFVNTYNKVAATVEGLFQMPWGSIAYYNGSGFTETLTGLVAPNGLVMSADKRFLYNALPNLKQIHVYRHDVTDGVRSLVLVQVVNAYSCVDNLQLGQGGRYLYATGHPIPHKTIEHLEDPTKKAPSHVLRFPVLSNGSLDQASATELFYDHGQLISASTVANVYKDKLIIGSLLDTLVVCDI